MNENMKDEDNQTVNVFEKIKNHIKENKKHYITYGAAVGTAAIMVAVFARKIYINNSNVVNNNVKAVGSTRRGRPGIPVMNTRTGEVYPSILKAAIDTGIPYDTLRRAIREMAGPIDGEDKYIQLFPFDSDKYLYQGGYDDGYEDGYDHRGHDDQRGQY